jgi:predicted nicotinamide N-methyase
MKQVFKDKIINIDNNIADNKFLIKKLDWEETASNNNFEVVFLSDLLEKRKNLEMLEKSKTKPATWSNVYSPKDEFEIFEELFENAIKNNKKIHIV